MNCVSKDGEFQGEVIVAQFYLSVIINLVYEKQDFSVECLYYVILMVYQFIFCWQNCALDAFFILHETIYR